MADIRLVKPQPNTAQTVSCAADSRFVFEFPSDTALFAKDGNDLVLTFEDGSSLRLQNFYTTYSREEMPTFEMEGTEISGEDFFAALGDPDLMPAAGPSASAQGNSSFNVYDSAALMDGIDRLDGLDIGFAWGQQPQEDLYASIGHGDDDDAEVTPVPEKPTIEGGTENGTFTVTTDEGNIEFKGSGSETSVTEPHGAAASGTLSVNLDHAEGTISIGSLSITVDKEGNVTAVSRDGASVEPSELSNLEVPGEHGSLSGFAVVAGEDGSITISYDYTLTSPVDGSGLPGNNAASGMEGRGEAMQADKFEVTVTTDGGTASGSIVASALDDVPVLEGRIDFSTDASTPVYDDAPVLQFTIAGKENDVIGLEELNFGADVDKTAGAENGSSLEITVSHGDEQYTFIASVSRDEDGNLHYNYNEDGKLVFEAKSENSGNLIYDKDSGTFSYTRPASHVGDGSNDSYSFDITLIDADGDHVTLKSDEIVTSLAPVEVPEQSINKTLVTDESYIDDGTKGSAHENEQGAISNIASGSFSVDLHGAAEGATITISTEHQQITGTLHLDENGKWMLNWEESAHSIPAEYGSLSVTAVSRNEDGTYTISYDYTQNKAYTDHPDSNDPDEKTSDAVDSFTVTVTSTDTGTISGTIGVQIEDDGPVLTMKQDAVLNEGSIVSDVNISGSFELAYGADLAAEEDALTVQIDDGESVSIAFDDDNTATAETSLGVLIVRKGEDGTYTYQFSGETKVDSGNHTITFTATDADGDSNSASVTVNVDKTPSFDLDTGSLVTDDSYMENGTKGTHEPESSSDFTNTASGTLSLDMADMDGASIAFKVAVGGAEKTLSVTLDSDGKITSWTLDGQESSSTATLTTQYGTLTIAQDEEKGTLTYTYTQTQAYTSHETQGASLEEHDEAAPAETITVTVTDKYEHSAGEQQIQVSIEDDGPVLTVTQNTVPEVSEGPENLVGKGPYEFVIFDEAGNASYRNDEEAGSTFNDATLSKVWGENVTISAGKVSYEWQDGSAIPTVSIEKADGYTLKYSQYADYEDWDESSQTWTEAQKESADWGIMVASPGESADHDVNDKWYAPENFETEAAMGDDNLPASSEAIIIDLNGQLAYGVNINFGAFYSDYKSEGIEQVLITFYKTVDGESQIVGTRIVQGNDTGSGTGEKITSDEQFLSAGFDKVVISALGNVTEQGIPTGDGNPQGSSFTIQSIDFVTAPNPINVVTGSATAASGADGFAADFVQQNVQFDMETMFGQPSDGVYTLQVLVNGCVQSATVSLQKDASGNSRLTGSVGETQLFTAYLEKNADDSFSWKMEQYVGFQLKDGEAWSNSFNLSFITKDGDGDWSSKSQTISLTPELVDDLHLTVDEAHLVENFNETEGAYTATTTLTIDDIFGKDSNFTVISAQSKNENGNIEIDSEVNTLIYTLKENIYHSNNTNNLLNSENLREQDTIIGDTIVLTVQDEQNNKYTFEIPINVIDDVPVLETQRDSAIVIKNTDEIKGFNFVGEGREYITNGIIINDDVTVKAVRIQYEFENTNGETNYKVINNITEISNNNLKLDYSNVNGKMSYAKIGNIELDENNDIRIENQIIHLNTKTEISIKNSQQQYESYEILIDDSGNIYIYTSGNSNIRFDNLTISVGDESKNIQINQEQIHSDIIDSLSGLCVQGGFTTSGEIGAGTLKESFDQGDGIKIELGENVAYGLSVKLGAFYSGGPSDEWDHYPERALLSFHLQNGDWIFQEVTPAVDGSISFTNDALIAQGFTEVYISAIDNVKLAEQVGSTNPAKQEQSDFVVQSVDFITPILISTGTLTSQPGADGYMEGYENAKFDTDKMAKQVTFDGVTYTIIYEESANGTLSAKLSGDGTLNGDFLFKAEIEGDDWTVMIFKEFETSNNELFDLHFITQDSEGDSVTTTVEIPSTIKKTEELYPDDSLAGRAENLDVSVHDSVLASAVRASDSQEESNETSDSVVDTIARSNEEETSGHNPFEEFITQIESWEGQQAGNDPFFGTDGDDYLVSGAGKDILFGGSGNDIVVYDQNDVMISGGSGIDFMVSNNSQLTMDDLLEGKGTSDTGPIVEGIDVLITGKNAESLTNMDQLAKDYGITLGTQDGKETLTLDMEQWTKDTTQENTYHNDAAGLTLQTNLQSVDNQTTEQEAVFIAQNTNG